MSGQQKPLRFNPSTGSFTNFQGDDVLWLNYTENTGYITQLQKSTNDVFSINNKGEVVIDIQASSTEPALKVAGRPTEANILNLYDNTAGDDLLSLTKTVNGSSFAADLITNSTNHADSEGLRVTHDVNNDTPLGKVLALGYSNTAGSWVEQFNFTPEGAFTLNDNGGADILWTNDGGGDIGASGATRPGNVFAEISVVAGVATTLKDNYFNIGPNTSDGNRQINALQNGTGDSDSPAIKYDQSTQKWQVKQTGGGSFVDINTGAGNDLDQAYDAFGGAGQVDVDAGTLTWQCTSPYDFYIRSSASRWFWADSSADTIYMETTSNTNGWGNIDIRAKGNYGNVTLAAEGALSGDVIFDAQIGIQGTAGSGISFSAGSASSFSTTSGAMTVSTDTGLLTAEGANVDITADGSTGTISLECSTVHDSANILFAAHGSGDIPFNSSVPGQTTLATSAQNIIGAINEVNSGGAITWDDIYANSNSLNIDSSTLVFSQTSTSGIGFKVDRALGSASTDSPIMQIYNIPNVSTDDQPGFQSYYRDDLGMAGDTVKTIEAAFESASGVTGGSVKLFNTKLTLNAGDSGGTFYGYFADGSTTGSWTAYGFYADSDWDYGLYSVSDILVTKTVSGAQSEQDFIGSSVVSSGRSDAERISLFRGDVTDNAGDSGTEEYAGIYLTTTNNGSGSKIGVLLGSDWDYGIYSTSDVRVHKSLTGNQPEQNFILSSITSTGSGRSDAENISLFKADITDNASDSASAEYTAVYLDTTDLGSAAKWGLRVNSGFDLGVTSASPGRFSLSQLTASVDAFTVSLSSGGMSSTLVKGVKSIYSGDAGDAGTAVIYGFSAEADTVGSASKYAFYSDANWAYSFYGLSPSLISVTPTAAAGGAYIVSSSSYSAASAALGASDIVSVSKSTITPNAGDNGAAKYYGFHAAGSGTGNATKYGFYADANWDYGLYFESPTNVTTTPSSAPGGTYITSNSTYNANSAALGLGDIVKVINTSIAANAGDNASSIYYGLYAEGSTTGSAYKAGVFVDSNWNAGIYATSPVIVSTEAASGVGSTGHWSTYSRIAPATTLASNDEVSAFTADINDDSGDAGAFYYGLYVKCSGDAGAASKRGIYFDTNWPSDHHATWINSGLHYWAEDFGTVTSNTDHLDVNLSGLLNSSIDGRCINLDITPDSGQSDGSSWYGVRANMVNANANDAVGSFAFHANDNWHYGLYVGNDLSKQQAPNEGTVHVESTSSSLIASGDYYGYSYYHTRHVSDTGGNLSCFYAQANTAVAIGSTLTLTGIEVGDNLNYGITTGAETNIFARGASDWTSSILPVVAIGSSNSSNTAASLYVGNASTSAAGKCLEIDHSYDGGNTQDTKRAVILSNTSRNRRSVDIDLWQSLIADGTSYSDYYMNSSSTGGTAHRWRTNAGDPFNKVLHIPLLLPHASTLQNVIFLFDEYNGNSATESERPFLQIFKQAVNSPSATQLGSTTYVAYSTGTESLTITISSLNETVDNTSYTYFARFTSGDNTHGAIFGNGCQYDYDITDLGAAPGL